MTDKSHQDTVKVVNELGSQFWFGLATGILAGSAAVWITHKLFLREKTDAETDSWSNKKIKENVLELVGHTPILKLPTISRVLGNEVFVGSE